MVRDTGDEEDTCTLRQFSDTPTEVKTKEKKGWMQPVSRLFTFIKDKISWFRKKLTEMVADNLSESVKSCVKSLFKETKRFIYVLIAVAAGTLAFWYRKELTSVMSVFADMLRFVLSGVSSWWKGSEKIVSAVDGLKETPPSSIGSTDLAAGAITVTSVLAFMATKSKSFVDVFAASAKIVAGCKAFSTITAFVADMLPECVSAVVYNVSGCSLQSVPVEVRLAMRRAHRICAEYAKANRIPKVENDRVLAAQVLETLDLMAYIEANVDIPRSISVSFFDLKRDVMVHMERSKELLNRTQIKKQPWFLYLFGKAGHGKTGYVSHLATCLYPQLDSEERVCFCNAQDKYDSSYQQQRILAYDDFGCTSMEAEVYAKILRLVSTLPITMIKADVSEKGMYFTSDGIVATTNLPPNANLVPGLVCPDAFNRRAIFVQAVAHDWALDPQTQRLDPKKTKKDFSHMQFFHHPYLDGRFGAAVPITHDKLVAMLRTAEQDEAAKYRATIEAMRVIERRYKAQLGGAEDTMPKLVPIVAPTSSSSSNSSSPVAAACETKSYSKAVKQVDVSSSFKGQVERATPVERPPAMPERKMWGDREEEEADLRAATMRAVSSDQLNAMPPVKAKRRGSQKCLQCGVSGHKIYECVTPECTKCSDQYNCKHRDVVKIKAMYKCEECGMKNKHTRECSVSDYKAQMFRTSAIELLHPVDYANIFVNSAGLCATWLASYYTGYWMTGQVGKVVRKLCDCVNGVDVEPRCEAAVCHAWACGARLPQDKRYCLDHETIADMSQDLAREIELERKKQWTMPGFHRVVEKCEDFNAWLKGKMDSKVVLRLECLIACVAGMFLLGKIVKWFFSKPKEHYEAQAARQGRARQGPYPPDDGRDYAWHRTSKKWVDVTDNPNFTNAEPPTRLYTRQGWRSPAVRPTRSSIERVRRNMVRVSYQCGTKTVGRMWGLRVRSNSVLMPAHFFHAASADAAEILVVEGFDFDFKCPLSLDKVTLASSHGESVDLAVYDFGIMMPIRDRHYDVDNLFVSSSFRERVLDGVRLLNKRGDEVPMRAVLQEQRAEYVASEDNVQVMFPVGWVYEPQVVGDCGRPLMAAVNGDWRIIGMHVCERNKPEPKGVSIALDKDLIDTLLCNSETVYMEELPINPNIPVPECDVRAVSLLAGEYVPDLRQVALPMPFLEEKWHTREFGPAVVGSKNFLNPGHDPKQIVLDSIKRVHNATSISLFPQAEFATAVADTFAKFGGGKFVDKPRVLFLDEVINGGMGLPEMNMDGSPGYPLSRIKASTPEFARMAGKKAFFSVRVEGKRVITYEPLAKAYVDGMAALRKGYAYAPIHSAFAKNELRALNKVMEALTRVVIGSPTLLTMHFRAAFGAFVGHVFNNPIIFGSAVGINMYSRQFDQLVRWMREVSPVGFDGDYKSFEMLCSPQFLELFLEHVEAWYQRHGVVEEGDAMMRRTLIMCMPYYYMRVGSDVMQIWGLLLSGGFLTTILNTVLNLSLTCMSFLLVAKDRAVEHANLDMFHKSVRSIAYGDDVKTAVSPLTPYYNAKSHGDVLAQFGVKFTPATKGGELCATNRPLEECEFLKCTECIEYHFPGWVYYPVPSESMLMHTISYVMTTALPFEQVCYLCANDVLVRVWGCGQYEKWYQRLDPVVKKLNLSLPLISQARIREMWQGGTVPLQFWSPNSPNANALLPPTFEYVAQMERVPKTQMDGSKLCADASSGTNCITPEACAVTPLTAMGQEGVARPPRAYHPQVPSVGTVLKRFFPVADMSAGDMEKFSIRSSQPLSSESSTNSQWFQSGIAWYANLYRLWAGNMKFHVRAGDPNTPLSVATTPFGALPDRGWKPTTDNRMGPILYTTGSALVVVPFTATTKMAVVPWYYGEEDYVTSSPSTITVAVGNDAYNFPGEVPISCEASLGDDFRFSCLSRIPRVTIVGDTYPHPGGVEVSVEEFQHITFASGPIVTFTQQQLDQCVKSGTVPATGAHNGINELVIPSSALTNAQLRQLGYNISDTQGRDILTGETNDVNVTNAGNIQVLPAVVTVTQGSATLTPSFTTDWVMNPEGTSYSFITESKVPFIAASSFTTTTENSEDVKWLDAMSVGTGHSAGYLKVSNMNVYNADVTVTFAIPTTPVYVTVDPTTSVSYTVYRFSDGATAPAVGPALGFGAPTGKRRLLEPMYTAQMEKVNDAKDTASTLASSQPIQVVSGGKNALPPCEGDISEYAPSDQSIVMRFQFIETLSWSVTHAVGSVLKAYDTPFDVARADWFKQALKRYVYAKMDVEFSIQITSTAYQCGALQMMQTLK